MANDHGPLLQKLLPTRDRRPEEHSEAMLAIPAIERLMTSKLLGKPAILLCTNDRLTAGNRRVIIDPAEWLEK